MQSVKLEKRSSKRQNTVFQVSCIFPFCLKFCSYRNSDAEREQRAGEPALSKPPLFLVANLSQCGVSRLGEAHQQKIFRLFEVHFCVLFFLHLLGMQW